MGGNIYFVTAGVACGSDLPIINVTGGTGVRIGVSHLIIGHSGSPADIATLYTLVRTTDAGTGGTALTEIKTDPLTATPTGAAVKGTYSADPTDSDEVIRLALNQRATHQIILPDGEEVLSLAASANGLMWLSVSSGGTPQCDLTFKWKE